MASVAQENRVGFDLRHPVLFKGDRNRSEFPVIVDYNWSVERMVSIGAYAYVNEYITSMFPVTGSGLQSLQLRLVHFRYGIKISEVEEYTRKMEYMPAGIEHLLMFGFMYPKMQLEFPVICLGSKWEQPGGAVNVPVLNGFNGERSIGLYLANETVEHHGNRRFLVIE